MKLRGLSALALLVVAVALERAAYYGGRSVLALDLSRQGGSLASVGPKMALLQGFILVGTLVGGAAALGIGPRATATLGLLVAAAGQFAIAAGAPIATGAGVVSFGAGVLRPCIFAAAAEVLAWDDESPDAPGPHRFAAVSALAVAAYAAGNLGGLFGPVSGAMLRARGGDLVYTTAGAVTLFAALLAAGAALLGLRTRASARGAGDAGPYRAAPPPAPAVPVPAALGGVGILLAAQAVYVAGTSIMWPPTELYRSAAATWIYSVNPLAVLAASLFYFGLLVAAAVQRWTLPPLHLYGAGLVVVAFGLAMIAASSSSVAIYALGSAVTGVGEAAAYGVPLAYAAIAVRGRAATLVVAGWCAASLLVSTVSTALGGFGGLRTPLLVLCAILDLGLGVALLVYAPRLHRAFFDPPRRSA